MNNRLIFWMCLVAAILFLSSCQQNQEIPSETVILKSGVSVESYEYIDVLNSYRLMYPIDIFIQTERTVGEDTSTATWYSEPISDNTGNLIELTARYDNGNKFPSLDSWMRRTSENSGEDWQPTQINAGGDAFFLEVNGNMIGRHLWVKRNNETYAITLLYPKNNLEVAEDAERIWQVVVETFEFLP